MYLVKIGVLKCNEGDILADDVYSANGTNLIVAKDAVLNTYILERLMDMGIDSVRIYGSMEDEHHSERSELQLTYKKLAMHTKDIFQDMVAGKEVECSRLSAVAEELYQSFRKDSNIVNCMSEIRNKDEYTYYHSINVSFYAMLIAKWLKLPNEEIKKALLSGLLHDIGKIKISDSILNKADSLTPTEYEIVKKHTLHGYEIVKDFDYIHNDIKEAILMHHERLDGSGYPFRYTSDNINIFSKIVAIADVFDAMTSERVYKNRNTPFEVFKTFQIEGACLYDIRIMNVFMKNMANYLIGSKVFLSNGKIGDIVYIPYQSFTQPIVRIGDAYIDLSREDTLKIVKML
jgi:putative nucleotidyltransferase with HDIG domain